jgi:hypothetical protein
MLGTYLIAISKYFAVVCISKALYRPSAAQHWPYIVTNLLVPSRAPRHSDQISIEFATASLFGLTSGVF